jgi:thiol-disulfide isomerase/thioredoxin
LRTQAVDSGETVNNRFLRRCARVSSLLLAFSLACTAPLSSAQSVFPFASATEGWRKADSPQLATVAEAVRTLLVSGDAEAFASALTPTEADQRAILRENNRAGIASGKPLPESWAEQRARDRGRLLGGARHLLGRAAERGVDFSRVELSARVQPPSGRSGTGVQMLAESEFLEAADMLMVTLTAKAREGDEDAQCFAGDYRVALDEITCFPAGLRCGGGVRWLALPKQFMDEALRVETTILGKVAEDYGNAGLSAAEDPALAELGESLARALRERDPAPLLADREAMFDAVWARAQRDAPPGALPPEDEARKMWRAESEKETASMREWLAASEQRKIDFSRADVRVAEARFGRLMARGAPGELDGLEGDELRVVLSVSARADAPAGAVTAGNYVLAATEATRMNGRWSGLRNLRWESLPEGVTDSETKAAMEFENHVLKTGTLPVGMAAPDFGFVRIADGGAGKLADLRGKIVILDFWSTDCGPCQAPMAKLQTYADANPAWGDRVAVVSLSIDDTLEVAKTHLERKGWNRSLNLWANDGGFKSAAAQVFRVRGIPTCYVIDAKGVIAAAGHPEALQAPEVVNRLLGGK